MMASLTKKAGGQGVENVNVATPSALRTDAPRPKPPDTANDLQQSKNLDKTKPRLRWRLQPLRLRCFQAPTTERRLWMRWILSVNIYLK